MGARIDGLRTDTLTIQGVDELHGATYSVMPDRIEAGSYACAAAITGGSLELAGARKETMPSILSGLQDAGLTIERSEEHTSELQSLMRISYAGFCMKKKNTNHYRII